MLCYTDFCQLRDKLVGTGEYNISNVTPVSATFTPTHKVEPFITPTGIPLMKDVVNSDYKMDALPVYEDRVTTPLRKPAQTPVLRRKSAPLPKN